MSLKLLNLRRFISINTTLKDINWLELDEKKELTDNLSHRDFTYLMIRLSMRYNILIPEVEYYYLTTLKDILDFINTANIPNDKIGKERLLYLRYFYDLNKTPVETV